MKLYHISRDFNKNIDVFTPRIPKHRLRDEDDSIKRICASISLEGCLHAHSFPHYYLFEYPMFRYFDPYHVMGEESTLLDHGEKEGFLFKVYEFEANESDIVSPQKLHDEKLVPDALKTNEYWIMSDICPTHSFYLFLESGEQKDGKDFYNFITFQYDEIGRIEDGWYRYNKRRDKELEEMMKEGEMYDEKISS